MIVGIEIGPGALRGTCATGGEARAVTEPFSGRVEDLSRALSALLAAIGTRARKIALAIPSYWCSYRTVSFPYNRAARVEGTLDYALEDRLDAPVAACVVEPLTGLLPSGDKGSRTLVAACPVETVSAVIEACRVAGVEPIVIQPAVAAAARDLRDRLDARADHALMIRLDGEFCELAWMGREDIRAAQVLRILSSDPDALAARIRLAVRSYEVSDGRESFDRAFLLSADGKHALPGDTLQKALGVPVTVVGGEGTEAALGAAGAAARDGHLAVNLRRGPCAYGPYARRTDSKIAAALLIAAGIMLVFAARTTWEIRDVRDALGRSKERQAGVFAEVVGRTGTPAVRPMQAALAKLEGEAARTGSADVMSCLRMWSELRKQVPPSSAIVFETIDVKQGGIALQARAANSAEAWQFRDRLGESGIFLPDPPAVTSNRAGGGVSFSMQLRYRP